MEKTVAFEVAGARYDGGELNYKYIDSSTDFDEAKHMYRHNVQGYPYKYLRMVVFNEAGRRVQELTIFGDLSESEITATRQPWENIKADFDNGLLTWTESFEALMVEAGMTMNDALKCIAEHFDHRRPIAVTEVM